MFAKKKKKNSLAHGKFNLIILQRAYIFLTGNILKVTLKHKDAMAEIETVTKKSLSYCHPNPLNPLIILPC